MKNKQREINALFPIKIREGARIINESGRIETIYKIESENIGRYVSTFATNDSMFLISKTYFIKGKEGIIEKIGEEKRILENLEKATRNYIEKEMGLNALASQLN